MADIKFNPGNPAEAFNKANAGDTILVDAGEHVISNLYAKPGINVIGLAEGAVFIVNNGSGIVAGSDTVIDGNQRFSNFKLISPTRSAENGLVIKNRNNVVIEKGVSIEGFGQVGLKLENSTEGFVNNIIVDGLKIKNSAYEGGNQSLGNITLYGSFSNSKLINLDINNTGPLSGYGIKARPSYRGSQELVATLKNFKFDRIKQVGKIDALYNGGQAENFFMEVWHVGGDGVEISNFTSTNCLSLEWDAPYTSPYSFWVHDFNMLIPRGGVGEFASHGILCERGTIDFRQNKNPWVVFGEFNSGNAADARVKGRPLKITVKDLNLLLGNSSPSIFVYTTKADIEFANINIDGAGKPAILELRRPSSNGSKLSYSNIKASQFAVSRFDENANASTLSVNTTITPPKPVEPPVIVNPPVVNPPVTQPAKITVPSEAKLFDGLQVGKPYLSTGVWKVINAKEFGYSKATDVRFKQGLFGNGISIQRSSLKPGKYFVVIGTGEDNAKGTATIEVNGVKLLDNKPYLPDVMFEVVGEVVVGSDGLLTIKGWGTDVNIFYVDIYQFPEVLPETLWVPYEKDPRYEYQIRLKK